MEKIAVNDWFDFTQKYKIENASEFFTDLNKVRPATIQREQPPAGEGELMEAISLLNAYPAYNLDPQRNAEWINKKDLFLLHKSNQPVVVDKNFNVRLCAFIDKVMKETGVRDAILEGSEHHEDFEKKVNGFFDRIKTLKISPAKISSSPAVSDKESPAPETAESEDWKAVKDLDWYAWDKKGMVHNKPGVPIEDVFILSF